MDNLFFNFLSLLYRFIITKTQFSYGTPLLARGVYLLLTKMSESLTVLLFPIASQEIPQLKETVN